MKAIESFILKSTVPDFSILSFLKVINPIKSKKNLIHFFWHIICTNMKYRVSQMIAKTGLRAVESKVLHEEHVYHSGDIHHHRNATGGMFEQTVHASEAPSAFRQYALVECDVLPFLLGHGIRP